MKTTVLGIILIFLLLYRQVVAEPGGQQLLEACENTANKRASDIETMMCDWYITPCNCDTSQSDSIPRVCLPDNVSSDELRLIVVKALKSEPEMTRLGASKAAATILSRNFPCKE